MSISATYTVGTPTFSITSGGQAQATLVLTYAMSGDGASTAFVQPVGGFGLGTPASVTATITKQQITGTPPVWKQNNVYALNTIVQANGFLQKVTTAGTSMPGWSANTTFALNQTICDPYGNEQICTVGGTSGTSLPTNFAANMIVGAQTQDNGVTWQCVSNTCPNFSNVTNATTNDNTVVWTCQGANSVVPTYDAPGVTPTLSGTNLTLTFNEALKAPGATNTDAYGTIFTYTAWVVAVTLTFTSVANSGVQSQSVTWTSATAANTTTVSPVSGASAVVVQVTDTGTVSSGVINFQISADGQTWFSIQGIVPSNFGNAVSWSLASGAQTFVFDVAGFAFFRTILTTIVGGTGSVTVIQQTSNLDNPTSWQTVGQPNLGLLFASVAGVFNSSAPVVANTSQSEVQVSPNGNVLTQPWRRSQVKMATGSIAATAAATLLAAQGAGIFADLKSLVLTLSAESAAAYITCNISDGTNTYEFGFASEAVGTAGSGSQPVCINWDVPIPATTANTAWTIALSVADATIRYVAQFVNQTSNF